MERARKFDAAFGLFQEHPNTPLDRAMRNDHPEIIAALQAGRVAGQITCKGYRDHLYT